MLERETSLTESALQQAVQSVENKLETYNNLSNYMFNNTSILQALNTEYSKDYFRMYKAYQDTIAVSYTHLSSSGVREELDTSIFLLVSVWI